MCLATCNCVSSITRTPCDWQNALLMSCSFQSSHFTNESTQAAPLSRSYKVVRADPGTISTFLSSSSCHFTQCRFGVVHEVLADGHGVRSFTGQGEDGSVIRKLRTCQRLIGLNCQTSRTVLVTQAQNSVRPPRGSKVFLPPSRRESQQKGELPWPACRIRVTGSNRWCGLINEGVVSFSVDALAA